MLELDPLHKLVLIVVSAGMVGISAILLLLYAASACHSHKKDKKSIGSNSLYTSSTVRSSSVYGSNGKSGIPFPNYTLSEEAEDLEVSKYVEQGMYDGGPNALTEGSLLSKLSAARQTSTISAHSANSIGSFNSAQSENSADSGAVRSGNRTSRQDSSYSSMSSGRTSPSAARSVLHGSTPGDLKGSLAENIYTKSMNIGGGSSITVSLLLTQIKQVLDYNDTVYAKLAISVESVCDLPSREYRAHCDPWVAVTVLRDRRSLRRRPPASIAYFKTKTIRHAHNPFFSQTFVADLQKNEIKDISVRWSVMDQDRYTGPREIGRATVTLKEARQTVQDPERSTLCLLLTQVKRDRGEIQFGLSYLPTAQRLSFSIAKAFNIRFDKEDCDNADKIPNPYVKLLMFNQTGRMVKKKKTCIKYGTKEPFFDETVNFEAEPSQLETHTVLVVILSKREQSHEPAELGEGLAGLEVDSSDQESYYKFDLSSIDRRTSSATKSKDHVLGVICLGKQVRGDKEREQWTKMMESPRKVFSSVHSFK